MKFLLDILFPKICVECGKQGEDICNECMGKIKPLRSQQCPNCRNKNPEGEFCSNSCSKNHNFEQLIVCTHYEKSSPIQKLIINFKYKFSKDLINVFHNVLKDELKKYTKTIPENTFVIPAPIHKRNFKKRGFNQALLLAQSVTKIFPQTQLLDCLIEKDNRIQQAKLDKAHRLTNLKNSIEIRPYPPLKNILLIDDVATTLSTLNECSKVLKKAGASHICGIVLARG